MYGSQSQLRSFQLWRPLSIIAVAFGAYASLGVHAKPALRFYQPPVTLPEPDTEQREAIVRILLDNQELMPATLALANKEELLLGLGTLARLLDFPIIVNAQAGTAQGWFIAEHRRLELSLADGIARADGREWSLDATTTHRSDEEIFISTAALSQWLPLDISVDMPDATVALSPREPLPITQAAERARRLQDHVSRRGSERLPQVRPEYRLATLPYGDLSLHSQSFARARTDQQRGSLLLAGDLAFMSARAFISGQQRGTVDQLRFSLERLDVEGQVLGSELPVTELALGDLFTRPVPLLADTAAAMGMTLSNQPLGLQNELDNVTLRGEAPPNWDVELYRDMQLLSFARVAADGRYEFAEIPVFPGPNDLRVVLLGPQGQRRERAERFHAGPGLIAAGQLHYRLFLGEHEERLFDTDRLVIDPGTGQPRRIATLAYGLRRGLSIAASVAQLPLQDRSRSLTSVGLRGQYAGWFTRMDLARAPKGGGAVELAMATRIGPGNMSASHAVHRNFSSELTLNEGGELRSQSILRFDGPLRWRDQHWAHSTLSGEYIRFVDRRIRLELRQRLSLRLGNLAIAHELDHHRFGLTSPIAAPTDTPRNASTRGNLLLSGRLGSRGMLRLSAQYELSPGSGLQGVNTSYAARMGRGWDWRVDATHSRAVAAESQITLSVSQRSRMAHWGLSAGYSDRQGASLGANLSFSLGRDPVDGGLLIGSAAYAQSGLVHAQPYLDINGDGRRASTEPGLARVRFRGSGTGEETRERGSVLPGQGRYRGARVHLDPQSLADPFWVPSTPGYEVLTRPGRVTELEFAIVPTGEVDGRVLLVHQDASRPVSGVQVQLHEENGERRYSARSAFDGYFLFQRVPQGQYQLSISVDQLPPGHQTGAPQRVQIDGAGDWVADRELMITRSSLELPL